MLSKRLETIVQWIHYPAIIADIGTDHALLPVYCVLHNKAAKAYATDNKNGPLKRAIQTINKFDCQNLVIPVLSNGLTNVPHDADTWIISGMGFETTQLILLEAIDRFDQCRNLIIQVNSQHSQCRRFLAQHGFEIVDESMVFEHHYYQTIQAVYQSKPIQYTDLQLEYGPILLTKRTTIFIEYLIDLKGKKQHIYHQIPDNSLKKQKLSQEITIIESIIKGCI